MATVLASLKGQVLLVAAGAALPALIIVGILFGRSGLPVVTLAGITLIWYAALFAGLREARKEATTSGTIATIDDQKPALDLVEEMGDYPSVAITAVASSGVCPLGVRAGLILTTDDYGRLSRPLCLPAVNALRSALGHANSSELAHGVDVACECPFKPRSITFNIQGEEGMVYLHPFWARNAPHAPVVQE